MISVRPALNAALLRALADRGLGDVKVFGQDLPLAIQNRARVPESVGADRLMNASAAAFLYPREAVIVVSLGTALTHDLVDSAGAFRGGMIAPGLRTQLRTLHQAAALLPEVAVKSVPAAIGGETHEAIAAGVYWGIVGAIERSCQALREHLEALSGAPGLSLRIIATGGDAELIARSCPIIEKVVPDLALLGLWRTALAARRQAHP